MCVPAIKASQSIYFYKEFSLFFSPHVHENLPCPFSDIESANSSTPKISSLNVNSHTNHVSTDTGRRGEGGMGDGHTESEAVHALICRIQQAEGERDLFKEELSRALEQIEKLK